MFTISVFVHKIKLEKEIAEAISAYLTQNINRPVLFLVSGGSALRVLDFIDSAVLTKNITVSLVDERFSRDPKINNFLQLANTVFYRRIKAVGATFIRSLPEESESLQHFSNRWEDMIRGWFAAHQSGRVVVALLGIGLDGHTAGIVPFPKDQSIFAALFEDKTRWIVGYYAGKKEQYSERVTVSTYFLKSMVDYVFMYASGENKKRILATVLSPDAVVADHPAAVLHNLKQVAVYTDVDTEYR